MFEEYEKKKRRQVSLMRSLLDYAMGVVFVAVGVFFFFRDKLGEVPVIRMKEPDWVDKVLGVLCVVYGAWRLYRGYKKNYFK